MTSGKKTILGVLLALLILSLGAVLLTRSWANYRERLRAIRLNSKNSSDLVDTHAMDTAQQVAALAVTRMERQYAQEALRLADQTVDLAFAAALEDAAKNPAPPTTDVRQASAHVRTAEASQAADQDKVTQLTQKVAKAQGTNKQAAQDTLDLAQAQLALDQDEVAEAHQDLVRAGGDRQALIQRQLDQYQAAQTYASKAVAPAGSGASDANATPSVELTKDDTVWAQTEALLSLRAKGTQLLQAQQDAFTRSAKLAASRDALKNELGQEKTQKKVLHGDASNGAADGHPETSNGSPAQNDALSYVRVLGQDQKNLITFNKRIEDEQQLAKVYSNWIAFVTVREKAFLHGLFLSAFWVLLIGLFVFVTNEAVQRFFGDIKAERRELHALRAVSLFALQVVGVVFVLLVIFGKPNNFATVVALAGAGLTVALKDFIVGFLGWFVLMGKNGIRPGDWVEINGVGGEVLDVGPLRTVLLETGDWTDAGHPTGRKVTFINSFAIEGHYFNFSTSGQWLWDELEVQAPPNSDPFAIAEAVQKIAADETGAGAKEMEQEWDRVTPGYARREFSAVPSLSVRPSGGGVMILVRYITKANERYDVRARLYRAVVDLLNKKQVSQGREEKTSVEPSAERK
jgi:small-conductance mechanosensitive channel